MSVLVIAEHDAGSIKSATFNSVSAALLINADVHVLVAGLTCGTAAEQAAKINGVTKVLLADAEIFQHSLAENLAPLVTGLASSYDHIVFNATAQGKNVAPRVSALLDVAQISDITKVISADTFERPIYAGNAIATVQATDSKIVITVRSTAFDAVSNGPQSAPIVLVDAVVDSGLSSFIDANTISSDRPELISAKVIVSGGRALGSSESYQRVLTPLAEKLGAAMGASRAAVDSGYAPNDAQVGQTGKIVAPDLYIAVGISGAIQHLAGMKDSKVIVAINNDPDAPIFNVADYGIVGDLYELVPELAAAL
ncbi:electron transfer flavoprotein subunit alpha/FixB family protein [Pseudomonas antarctica]|uniref:electron transfer flavoprotein subunit alpha/FixB family protein n=1 Tax=Pseudomonas antarctica TaxID=219572 RepID=UPI00345D54F9